MGKNTDLPAFAPLTMSGKGIKISVSNNTISHLNVENIFNENQYNMSVPMDTGRNIHV